MIPDRDPADLQWELQQLIALCINAAPRSQQTVIGPSEVGTPCERKLAYKLLGTPEANPRSAAWRPTVGTAVHQWLDDEFNRLNPLFGDPMRFHCSTRVDVGWVADPRHPMGGYTLRGTADLYDLWHRTVIDWKIVGPAKIKEMKRVKRPEETYVIQTHCYGAGFWRQKKLPVERVAVMFLPSNGELTDSYLWSEPFQPHLADQALERASQIHREISYHGEKLPGMLAGADDHCQYCPWMKPGAKNLAVACCGAEDRAGQRPDSLHDML